MASASLNARTYSEGCCSLFRILCSISSVRITNYLALHQIKALAINYTRVKKEQQNIVKLQPLAQYCAHAHSVPRSISSFVRSYIDSGNPGKPQCLTHTLWNNE